MNHALLKVAGVSKRFGGLQALRSVVVLGHQVEVSFEIPFYVRALRAFLFDNDHFITECH